jgi:prepilin-type N-terminal cleavage/methylation domain-containing protein/prepilin-type processing-associated H-X9-DG protein
MRFQLATIRRNSASAFTLIELLVVMSIIATLAALLNTGISKSKASAQSTFCKNNLRQLGTSLELFVSEFQSYPVNDAQTKPISPGHSDRFWMAQLARDGLGIAQPAPGFYTESIWRCPSSKWSAEMLRSPSTHLSDYGYNDDKFSGAGPKELTNKFGLQGHYAPETDSYSPIGESEVTAPSDMIAIGDCFEGNAILMRKPVETYAALGNIRTRHRARSNVIFCDGHIESPTLENLFEENTDTALRRWNRDHQPHSK